MRSLPISAVVIACLAAACGGEPGRDTPASSTQLRASTSSGASVELPNLRDEYTLTMAGGTVVVLDNTLANPPQTIDNPHRLYFADQALAFDRDGVAGQAYRVYQAAFDRKPDIGGLSFWIGGMDDGLSLEQVSAGFVGSEEFRQLYGATPSNAELVDRLYRNVLHRAPEQGGFDFWVSVLDRKASTRAQVLTGFSESDENKAGVAAAIAAGIPYVSSRIPNAAQAMTLLRSSVWVQHTEHGPHLLRVGASGEYLLSDPMPASSGGQPGVEYGMLSVTATDAAGYAIRAQPSVDTNGTGGLSGAGPCLRLKVANGNLLAGDVGELGCGPSDISTFIKIGARFGPFGAWTLGGTGIKSPLIAFLTNGRFAMADPIGDTGSPSCGGPGAEAGTYNYDAATGMISLFTVTTNSNGCAGLAENGLDPGAPMEFIAAPDGKTATLGGTTIYRVN